MEDEAAGARSKVSGRVLGSSGEGVADVCVSIYPSRVARSVVVVDGTAVDRRLTTTDATGGFEFVGLERGHFDVVVSDDLGEVLGSADDPTAPARGELVLDGASQARLSLAVSTNRGSIGGLVRDTEGQAVDGVLVWLRRCAPKGARCRSGMVMRVDTRRPADQGSHPLSMRGKISTCTQDGGRFRAEGLWPGTYDAEFLHPPTQSRTTLRGLQLSDEVSATLERLGALRVEARNRGLGVSSFVVRLKRQKMTEVFQASSGLSIAGLAPGDYFVEVQAEGLSAQCSAVVRGGEVGRVSLALEPGGRVRGRIVDENGRPRAHPCLFLGRGVPGDLDVPQDEAGLTKTHRGNATGWFELSVPQGNGAVLVVGESVPIPGAIRYFTVRPEEVVDLGDIVEGEGF